jgi:SAM-dependent methyltransferase
MERAWLARFAECVPPGGAVLDVGCGHGEPIGRDLASRGFDVMGVDSSPTLIGLCRAKFPQRTFVVGDMRTLDLGRTYDGVVAWDSLFHLAPGDQRTALDVLARHAGGAAALLFTSGPAHGEVLGAFEGEPLYHASLAPDEYRALLAAHGFEVRAHQREDPECGGHTVWLAVRR